MKERENSIKFKNIKVYSHEESMYEQGVKDMIGAIEELSLIKRENTSLKVDISSQNNCNVE